MSPDTPARPRLAAIDVGTNSTRLVVAEVEPGGSYRILDEEREMTRLGEGLYDAGRLTDLAMARSLEAIGKMKAIAAGFGVRELRVIATSAVREAENGREFLRLARQRHRLRVEVITAEEEAQLAFRSAARHFDLEDQPTAVVDIGGGSMEVVLAQGTVIDRVHSLPLGAVRLTERHLRSDPIRRKEWKRLKREIDRTIERELTDLPFPTPVMIGSGGTFAALAAMALFQREGQPVAIQGSSITRAEVVHLLDRLRETPLEERRRMHGLSPDRADIIVAGAAAVSRLARRLRCQRILVNDRGIRDGLLLSMIAEMREETGEAAPEPRDRIERVRRFARKCRSNERHTRQVAMLADRLFDDLKDPFSLPEQGRDVLIAAALLHDIGYLISHAQHHKHAYHLILHGEMPGFSGREVELVANVARYHRRAFPKKKHPNFARLSKRERRLVRHLSGILRVADGLDRSHAQAVTGVRATVAGDRVRLEIDAEADPHVESWDARRKAGLFEEAFGVELEILWRGGGAAEDGVVELPERASRVAQPGRARAPRRERAKAPGLLADAAGAE